jgi:hypothetical protein
MKFGTLGFSKVDGKAKAFDDEKRGLSRARFGALHLHPGSGQKQGEKGSFAFGLHQAPKIMPNIYSITGQASTLPQSA